MGRRFDLGYLYYIYQLFIPHELGKGRYTVSDEYKGMLIRK